MTFPEMYKIFLRLKTPTNYVNNFAVADAKSAEFPIKVSRLACWRLIYISTSCRIHGCNFLVGSYFVDFARMSARFDIRTGGGGEKKRYAGVGWGWKSERSMSWRTAGDGRHSRKVGGLKERVVFVASTLAPGGGVKRESRVCR